jgi:caffeoyl-CoA O-methyltransferase
MEMPQMVSGPLEGNFLRLLVQISGAKSVLEIGMFTGFSALSMAAGLPADGKLTTLELDPKCIETGKRYFARSEHGKKITIKEGPALESLKDLPGPFDFVFIDADKTNYTNYYNAVLPKVRGGGLILVDNVLWGGAVLDPKSPSDKAITELNDRVALDDRVDKVLLTIRDGVLLIRKK